MIFSMLYIQCASTALAESHGMLCAVWLTLERSEVGCDCTLTIQPEYL